MDLNELLRRYPQLRIAGPADNQRILDFFNASEMKGSFFSIRYERDPDFFAFFRQQAPEGHVVVGEENGKIEVIFTGTYRAGYVNGKLGKVGYWGDIRSTGRGPLRRSWRDCVTELFALSDANITVIIDDNATARKALVDDPRSPFRLLAEDQYEMVNLFGRTPFAARPSGAFSVERGSAKIADELMEFLENENRTKPFGFFFPAELPRRLKDWPGFSLGAFFLARRDGKICGCFAPWSPSPVKRVVIDSLPAPARILFGGLHAAFPALPAQGKELKISYLTHLEVNHSSPREEREEIFLSLVNEAFVSGAFRGFHQAAFPDFRKGPLAGRLKGFVTQRTPMTLYQAVRRGEAFGPIPSGSRPPAFEMALV